MNKGAIVSGVVSGIVGLAAGAGGVFLYFKTIQKRYNEELDESRALIKQLQEQKVAENKILKGDMLKSIKDELLKSNNQYTEILEEAGIQKPVEAEPAVVEVVSPDEDTVEINDEIRFIGPKDYEDDDDYEKEVIKYYAKDNVLTFDNEVMERKEFDDMCGSSALDSFGKFGASPNEVFVRNEKFMVDYKVKRYNLSHERYINGLS